MKRLTNLVFGVFGILILAGCLGGLHLSHHTDILMDCVSFPKTLSINDCVADYMQKVPVQAKIPAFWEIVLDYEITPEDPYWVLAQDVELDLTECAGGQCRDAVALIRTYTDAVPVITVASYLREVRTIDGVVFLYAPNGEVEVLKPDLLDMSIRQRLEDNAPLAPAPVSLQIYK